MSEWYEHPYPRARTPIKAPFVRSLYPADAINKGKTPSHAGDDVRAIKRAISRAGRWRWSTFNGNYYNTFSHGKRGGNVGTSGVAGFQRQCGIEDTGWMGEATFDAIRRCLIPKGLEHAGEPLLDAEAVRLLNLAAETFAEPTLIEPKQGFNSLHRSLHAAYSLGREMGLSDLGTYNPASTLPGGGKSDHAVYPAMAFDLGVEPDTGWHNQIGREFFYLMTGRPEIEYVILGDKIWSRSRGMHAYTAGGHLNHVHVSGRR